MRDRAQSFRDLNAEVIGIRIDGPFCHEAFTKSLNLDFTLLSDYNREIVPNYGVQYEDLTGFKGLAKRSTFVINQDGGIRYRWVRDEPSDLPNPNEVLEALW